MSWLKNSTLVFVVIFGLIANGALAHTYLSSVYLADGTALSEGDCVRPHPSTAYDSPIPLVTQADMTCGWLPYAAEAANRKCPIEAGTTIGIQWHHNNNASTDDIIDASHLGPIMVYMALSDSGNGSVWFKIYEDGYVNGEWAVTRLLANDGRLNFTIPTDIAAGNYLIRGEIIALHGAYVLNGAQPYVGCVEVTISSSGSASPSTVAMPGAYSPTDPGIYVNIYSGLTNYTIPGPAVYESGSSSSESTSTSAPTSSATASPTSSASWATAAPTSVATSAPTSAAKIATVAPTSSPSTSSSSSATLTQHSSSSAWWFAVAVSGIESSSISSVALKDADTVSSYTNLASTTYSYYIFSTTGNALVTPISVKVTTTAGSTLTAIFTEFGSVSEVASS